MAVAAAVPRLWLPIVAFALAAMQGPAAPSPAFDEWLLGFAARARTAGVGQATLERELTGLSFNPRVVALDRAQPDDAGAAPPSFARYHARQVPGREARGVALARDLAPDLAAIEARHGVPGRVLVAIWGMETSYGGYVGDFDLVRSLASLAHDGRRRALFEGELLAALRLIDSGRVERARLVGSWAGATGQPQFLPSSYAAHAIDGDGDGRADIWGSRLDTLASIANYLRAKGWRRGQSWGMPVVIPAGLERWRVRSLNPPATCPRVLGRHSRWIAVEEWRRLGVLDRDGRGWPPPGTLATLVEPDGPGGGAFLTYGNYRALLAYNCSNFYALSVGLLADRL